MSLARPNDQDESGKGELRIRNTYRIRRKGKDEIGER